MFTITTQPIDPEKLTKNHTSKSYGAKVTFEGIVRRDKHREHEVASLLYIADEPVCIAEGESIISEAITQFSLSQAVCVQRIGSVNAGETAIWIGVWSTHRDESFRGCRYILEEIKKRLLIWKKEFLTDGTSRWVRNQESIINL